MPERWFVLSALAPPPGAEFLMLDALRRVGARAVSREGQRVLAWLPAPRDVAAQLAAVESALRACPGMADPGLTWWWQSHEEWAAQWLQAVAPRRITQRIVVAPVGREFEQCVGDVVIRLEAGVAFGTAEHATTRGCLRILEAVVQPADRAIDVGTGSGILAIAAALLGAHRVLALEADPLACTNARRNAAANGVGDRVAVRELMVRAADLRALPPVNLVLANLEARLITNLLPGFVAALAPRGSLIVSGITGGERVPFLAAAAAAGLEPYLQENVEGWWCAAFRLPP